MENVLETKNIEKSKILIKELESDNHDYLNDFNIIYEKGKTNRTAKER